MKDQLPLARWLQQRCKALDWPQQELCSVYQTHPLHRSDEEQPTGSSRIPQIYFSLMNYFLSRQLVRISGLPIMAVASSSYERSTNRIRTPFR
jgi:hypothetical protein